MANPGDGGIDLVEQGMAALRALLGEGWSVTRLQDVPGSDDSAIDARVELRPPDNNRAIELLVLAKARLTPLSVQEQVVPVAEILRYARTYQRPLVIAPWLDPRTRAVLSERGISHLDLTGNVSLRVDNPAIMIMTEGANRAPSASSSERRNVTLAGPRAGRIIRALVDFEPPYRALEIADRVAVSLPWVSRLLGQLEDQLLIRRDGRTIVDVQWEQLLRARAETYDLVRNNPAVGMVAANGVQSVLDSLAKRRETAPAVITGPFAARSVAPLTSGGQLMIYVENTPQAPDELAEGLGLLRVDRNADVLVMRAHDEVVFQRSRRVDGVAHVALSQLVLDGLAGPGRMPAEAEAVLTYMREDQTRWREPWPASAA